MPENRIHFEKLGVSEESYCVLTGKGLRGMPKGRTYHALCRAFAFVQVAIKQGTTHKWTASLRKIHTIYDVILCDVTREKYQPS